jgi:hypothetical protein
MASTGKTYTGKLRSWKSWGLWVAAALGMILTVAGVALSLVTVNVLPQDEGTPVTALVGGGPAGSEGVTLQIGNYTVVGGSPQYTGTLARNIQVGCANASRIINGRSSEDVLPLTIEPIGLTECLANNQGFEADNGQLSVHVQDIAEIPAQSSSSGPKRYLPLSEISAQVGETATEISTGIAALILIAAGPGLVIGVLISIIQAKLPIKDDAPIPRENSIVEMTPPDESTEPPPHPL